MLRRGFLYACLLLAAVNAQSSSLQCGLAVSRVIPTIVNGDRVKYSLFPWHVGVYKKNPRSAAYDQICGGTLVSPDLVISAAHCFHGEYSVSIKKVEKYMIAGGKYFRPYDSEELNVQKSSVKNIKVRPKYMGRDGNYAQDIALVRLKEPFNVTPFVKPVCIDWDDRIKMKRLPSGKIGRVMGWGQTQTGDSSDELREISLPLISRKNCFASVPQSFRPFISLQDKFCAGLLNGSSVCKGDSGGGLCFESEGRWYLRGIVSTIPTGKTADLGCDSTKYAAFTDVGYYRDWIHEAYYGPRTGSMTGCILPDQPVGGSFQLIGCRGGCNALRNSMVPMNSVLVYKCNDGYALKGNRSSICGQNGWKSLSSCSKQCPPISDVSTSSGMSTFCKQNGISHSCDSSVTPGTNVSLACQDLYKISGTHNSKYAEMTCLDGGEWDHPALRCVPECGKSLDPGFHARFRGSLVQSDMFLWHVMISADLKSFCSGTLISESLLLTDAHCFTDNNGSLIEPNDIRVLAGLSYSFDKGLEHIAQGSYIQSVSVTNNVALIYLTKSFKISILVKPICVDWEDKFVTEQLRKGNIGKISIAFRAVKPGSVTRSLYLDIAYISREDCLSLGTQHKLHVPAGMFCGRVVSDEGIKLSMVVDRGQGLYFESNGVWYLRGILISASEIAEWDGTYRNYGVFMDIGHHLGWIHAAYDM